LDLDDVSVYASFNSEADARAVYDAALRKGIVQTVQSNDFDGTAVTFPDNAIWDPIDGPWGHNVVSKVWYVVCAGLVPGVYPTW
jgi:hypothetical protein